MKTWVTSDQHFYHRGIIDLCRPEFNSVEEMNEVLIRNWNNTVAKDDIVYVLGDFSLGNKDKTKEVAEKLNGRKFLVMGNHCGYNYRWYVENGFERVYNCPIIINDYYVLSHEPIPCLGPLFCNVFGHVHTNPDWATWGDRRVCVCVERHEYKPVEWGKIMKWFSEHKTGRDKFMEDYAKHLKEIYVNDLDE